MNEREDLSLGKAPQALSLYYKLRPGTYIVNDT